MKSIWGLLIWRWPGPVKRASSLRRDDFYPTLYGMFYFNSIKKFVSINFAGKRLFDQVVFTINSDVKPSCSTNVLILFS